MHLIMDNLPAATKMIRELPDGKTITMCVRHPTPPSRPHMGPHARAPWDPTSRSVRPSRGPHAWRMRLAHGARCDTMRAARHARRRLRAALTGTSAD